MRTKHRIVFNSGYVFEFKAEHVKASFNSSTGELLALKIDNMVPRLMHFTLSEIAAIIQD